MNWVEGIVVYVITWWLVIFCVLPIGVKRAGEEHLGHDVLLRNTMTDKALHKFEGSTVRPPTVILRK